MLLYNIFKFSAFDTKVLNSRYMKNVLGWKTEVKNAECIDAFLQHGPLSAGYIQTREKREL